MGRAGSIIGTVVVIGGVAAWKMWGPDPTVGGWEEAKAELMVQMQSGLQELSFPPDVTHPIADCTTGKIIEFLGTTDCKYKYDLETTTEAEHLATQEACFKEVGYEDKVAEFTAACMKEHMPAKWDIMSTTLTTEFAVAGDKAGCMAGKTIEALNASGCPLVNKESTTPETTLNTIDVCTEKHPELQAALDGVAAACGLGGAPAAE